MNNKICETIQLSKKLLRKKMKLIVNNLSDEERRQQSEEVLKKLTSLPQYVKSKRVSIYLSMDHEVNTLPIIKDMFARGKEIFIPKYKGKNMKMVKLYSLEDYERLPTTKWNIKQPADDETREDALDAQVLDLICLPGLAFTKCGKRLGYGMGYYDKYLNMYVSSRHHLPYLVALAFNEQLFADIPTTQYDFILDKILCDDSLCE